MGVEKMKTVRERKIKGQMQMHVLNKGYKTRRKNKKTDGNLEVKGNFR